MKPLVVGLTGPSASGKTTLAEAVRAAHGAAVILQQDWYYRDSSEYPPDSNFCDPTWLHVDELTRDVIALANGEPADVPVMDFATFERCGVIRLEPASLVIIEGMTILRFPAVDACLDSRFYIDTEYATIAERKRSRDRRDRNKPTEIVNAQLDWMAAEHKKDATLRNRRDVTVLSGDGRLEDNVHTILQSLNRDNSTRNPDPQDPRSTVVQTGWQQEAGQGR